MSYPADLKYTKDHEWIRIAGTTGEIGITDYAQQQLGDVVYVELPEVGRSLAAGEAFGSVESVKAVSELFSPSAGEVVAVNSTLKDHPETVNSSPYEAWMIKIRLTGTQASDGLLDSAQYESLVG
ncbi:MAG TPA: glycine cleavage system protein GcvH [Vicinamibacterales bacterium]|nr:glycine cleavage system protein GcvH [Vicinamibacterales bacterium]